MTQAIFIHTRESVDGTPEAVLEATCHAMGYDFPTAISAAAGVKGQTMSDFEACNFVAGRILNLWREQHNLDG